MLDWSLITPEVLDSVGIDTLLSSAERRDCIAYGELLSREVEGNERWSIAQKQCINLLKHALMMNLQPDHPSEPFGALIQFANGRSALPSDFPKHELIRLVPWMLSLANPELRSRLLDIAWVQARYFPVVQPAVHAYLEAAGRTGDFLPTPLKIFKRDGVLIFESKRKAAAVLT